MGIAKNITKERVENMAFKNWKGTVFLNSAHLKRFVDNTPVELLSLENYPLVYSDLLHSTYHCIVGNSLEAIALLYKDSISVIISKNIIIFRNDELIEQVDLDIIMRTPNKISLKHDGNEFHINYNFQKRNTQINIIDTKGNNWFAQSCFKL